MKRLEKFRFHYAGVVLCLGVFALADRMAGQTVPAKNDNAPGLPRPMNFEPPTPNAYTVLYNFCSRAKCADGNSPYANLVKDASGNFYGTTSLGGGVCLASGCGAVFKLDSVGNYTVLHAFCSEPNCADGETAYAGLIRDDSGNLYGTTIYGGAYHLDPNNNGGGTVFKLDSGGTYTILHSFCAQANCADGYFPEAGLTVDASGNLYGSTALGGANGGGTVFRLDSAGNYTTLHNFCAQANCADGYSSQASLTVDSSGNLYGTTALGGANGDGTVFKLDSAGNYTVLYSFCSQTYCADGSTPLTGLIKDASGNLYGTTSAGGGEVTSGGISYNPNRGVVFELSSAGTLTVLHRFCAQPNCTDGGSPRSLTEDAAGNFYGETSGGGTLPGAGTVFKLDSGGNYSTLYYFCSQTNCTDGYVPNIDPPIPVAGDLIQDSSGNLYGTTSAGGSGLSGVIFKLSSVAPASAGFTLDLNPATLTFSSPGSQHSTTLMITPTGGFNQSIAFSGGSCNGLPLGASCTFSQSTVVPNGGAVPITLTVSTTAASTAMQEGQPWTPQISF